MLGAVVNSEVMPSMSALIVMGTESISVCQVFTSLFKLVAVRQETLRELTQMEIILDAKHLLPSTYFLPDYIYDGMHVYFLLFCFTIVSEPADFQWKCIIKAIITLHLNYMFLL